MMVPENKRSKKDEKLTREEWLCTWGCQNLADYLSFLLHGKGDFQGAPCVQYDDEIRLTHPLSEQTCKWLEERFPFVSTYYARLQPIKDEKGKIICMINPNKF